MRAVLYFMKNTDYMHGYAFLNPETVSMTAIRKFKPCINKTLEPRLHERGFKCNVTVNHLMEIETVTLKTTGAKTLLAK